MELSKQKMKQIIRLMLLATALVLGVIYSKQVFGGIRAFVGILSPFLVGGIIAFILDLPMRTYENRMLGKWKGKVASKIKRPLCMTLSLVTVLLILTIVVGTVLPQVTLTVAEVGKKIPPFAQKTLNMLIKLTEDYPELAEQVNKLSQLNINWDTMLDGVINFLKNGAGNVINSTFNFASGIITGIVNFVISFIFAIYILSQKEKLVDQGRRIITAYLGEKASSRTLKVCALLHKNFSNFVTGQCLEAVILGAMFVISMSIFKMPYAFLVGVLIAFTALIPIVGAFIGCAVGAFLILIENPILAFWFVIMFLIIQQIEGNLIYPKVVGNSVGLPSIWVLAAVSIGGSLFGVAGMLFFIPLMSTGYALLRESVNERNAAKQAVAEKASVGAGSCVVKADTKIVQEEAVCAGQGKKDVVASESKDESAMMGKKQVAKAGQPTKRKKNTKR